MPTLTGRTFLGMAAALVATSVWGRSWGKPTGLASYCTSATSSMKLSGTRKTVPRPVRFVFVTSARRKACPIPIRHRTSPLSIWEATATP
jgi:hypothetical protein